MITLVRYSVTRFRFSSLRYIRVTRNAALEVSDWSVVGNTAFLLVEIDSVASKPVPTLTTEI